MCQYACKRLLTLGLASVLVITPVFANADNDEILATIGKLKVTASELEMAINSSPFATQFVAMDVDDQASLRGGLLQRLVASRLLRLEAEQRAYDQQESFVKEIDNFRTGLLYRYYLDKLREKITVPDDELARMKQDFAGNGDALEAAKSAYISGRYQKLRLLTIQTLRDSYHVKTYEDRLLPGAAKDTVVLQADGFKITYQDLVDNVKLETAPTQEWLQDRLYKRAELLLIARAAEDEGVDVSAQVESYKSERLPAILLDKMRAQWVGDEKNLKDYYDKHPELARIPERRHIGQIVLSTRAEAEEMRRRIKAGESLFTLAGQYSIDPYGREHNGDMGWHKEGSGMPELEDAVARLGDTEISPVIETEQGFHLLTVVERRPGGVRDFAGIRDRIRQSVISEHLIEFVNQLGEKYPVTWNVVNKEG
jgi:parvulin-like peptidyl-prolyl isomerase